MGVKKFFDMFKDGAKDFYGNPKIVFPGIIIGVFFLFVSKYGERIKNILGTTYPNIVWTIVVAIVSLVVMGYVFAGLIGMSKIVVKERNGKVGLRDFSLNANKFWFRNFVIMFVIALVSVVIERAAFYGGFFIGKIFGIGNGGAQFIFMMIYFIGLIGILIFLTFGSFYLVIYDLKVRESLSKSVRFVKREYLAVLSLSVILFVILFFLNQISGYLGDALEYLVFVPYISLILTRFVMGWGK